MTNHDTSDRASGECTCGHDYPHRPPGGCTYPHCRCRYWQQETARAVTHDGWNSGTSPRPPASSAQLLELERAVDKAASMLSRIDDVAAARGCPYTLGCLEVITRTLITAAEAVTGQ